MYIDIMFFFYLKIFLGNPKLKQWKFIHLPIYKDPRLEEVFSALGVPRKVVDTVLEPTTRGGHYRLCALSQIFPAYGKIPIILAFQACSLYWGHLEK